MSVRSELEAPENPHDEEEDPMRFHAWNVINLPPSEADLVALETEIESKFEELASKLYDDLEAEYDYQTDDEQVVDWVLNNLDDAELIGEEAEDELEQAEQDLAEEAEEAEEFSPVDRISFCNGGKMK